MTNRATYAQIEALVDFLEQNIEIAKGVTRSCQGKLDTKNKWTLIATHLNSLGGACKNGKGWAKYWAEKKCVLKKLCSNQASSFRQTGGGNDNNLPSLSAIEMRMVAVMGGCDFATGTAGTTIDPFPQLLNLQVSEENITQVMDIVEPTPNDDQHHQPSTSRSAADSCPRHRRSDRNYADANMERLAEIEARRVEGETMTAEALKDASEHFGKCADAFVTLSKAITEGANTIAAALLEIANKMPPPP